MKKHKLLYVLFFWLSLVQLTYAQTTISGKVVDELSGSALSNVSVRIKDTRIGGVSDNNGNFSINAPKFPATILFTMVGFEDQEVQVSAASNNLVIKMQENMNNTLNEVVVTGLASSIKRKNLANAVSSVNAAELTGVTKPQTTDAALYGKVTGANIRSNSGAPGGGMSIQLRGLSSLVGASQPLIILDGVYVNNSTQSTGRATVNGAGNSTQDDGSNRLADINPDEIENIEILKGPSAAAIYGTRANAGVIIITTKKGKEGRTKVSISEDFGLTTPLKLLGYDDWSEEKINYFYGGTTQSQTNRRNLELERFREAKANNSFVNYEDYFYDHQRFSSNTRLNVSGGTEKTKFFVAGGINDENGLIKNTGFQRYTVRANIDQKITNAIQLSVNSSYIRSNTDRGFTGNQNRTGASIGYAIAATPNYYDLRQRPDGTYPDNPYFTENPIALTDKSTNNSLVNRSISSFNLGIDLFKGESSYMKFVLNGGLDYLQNTTNIHLPEDLQYQRSIANPGDIMNGKQESFNTNLQAALVYNFNLKRVNMNSQVGMVRLDFKDDLLFVRGQGLAPLQKNVKQAAVQTIFNQFFMRTQEAGIFLQQEANFEDKIIGTLGVRFDKSSLNGNPNKLFAFPKASLAMNLTSFDFLRDHFISQLKPRIAYGETAGPVAFGATYSSLVGVNIGGLLGSSLSTIVGNVNILPESAKELEFGVDAGILKNRLSLEATYYIKNTANNIQPLNLSPSSGFTSTSSNLAELSNKGIELSLSGTPFERENFKWNSRLMFWKNDITISKLGIPTYTTGGFGVSYGTFLMKEGEKLGTIVGTPQINPGEYTVWGNSQPKFNMSFSNNLTIYKNFDFSFLFDWKKGGYNVNLTNLNLDEGGNSKDWFGDRNGDGIPNGKQREPEPFNNAGRFVEDASYIKLREVGLYYSMPTEVTQRLFKNKVQRFRAGISGNNLVMISKYSGYDPETSTFGNGLANNIDVGPYPSARRFFLNLSLDF